MDLVRKDYLSPCHIKRANDLLLYFMSYKSSIIFVFIFLLSCTLQFLSPKAMYLFFASSQQGSHLTDETGYLSLLLFLKTDFPHNGILVEPESSTTTTSTHHFHLFIRGVRKSRHVSGPETGLAWESTNLWDKRGNAVDNSRSCTVHKSSTFHHTH